MSTIRCGSAAGGVIGAIRAAAFGPRADRALPLRAYESHATQAVMLDVDRKDDPLEKLVPVLSTRVLDSLHHALESRFVPDELGSRAAADMTMLKAATA